MNVASNDVRPGKCFASSASGCIRRVLTVRDGIVVFEAKRISGPDRAWSLRSETPLVRFVEEATLEVGSDYIPNRNAAFLHT